MDAPRHLPTDPSDAGGRESTGGLGKRSVVRESHHEMVLRLLAESIEEVRDNPAAAERVLMGTGVYERDEVTGKLKVMSDDHFCVPSRAS